MIQINLNANPIESDIVFEFVKSKLSFELTFDQWLVIDVAMGEFWNNRVIGSIICNEDNAVLIYKHCIKNNLLISFERILEVTNVIWEYLESKGRFKDF